MRMAVDHYEVLGVSPEASEAEIKRAFRDLARRYHPDATGGDTEASERYKRISEAYSVLSDPRRRREYDASRAGFGAAPFGTTIEDIFETFFGGRGAGRAREPTRAARGESIEVDLEVDLREAVFGSERSVTLERHATCQSCEGSGCAPGTYPERCADCQGTGEVQQVRRTALGSLVTAFPCRRCRQTGWTVPSPCQACRGTGRIGAEVELPISVPPGIESDDRLRLRGEGAAGVAGGPEGDLYVRFIVTPDERFARNGDELETWVEIPVTTAALGGGVTFTSLDGEEELSIPAGTQSGSVFRIRGRGAARRDGRGRGNLTVRIHVATPTAMDDRQTELLRQLAELRGEQAGEGGGVLGRLKRALGFDE